jgi:hypothetical protein
MKTSAVTASALGLSRNETGRRFPHAEQPPVLEDLRAEITGLLEGEEWDHRWQVYDLEALTSVELDHLVERGLMTPNWTTLLREVS